MVTGGAGGIGGAIVDALGAAGFATEVLDLEQCDLGDADSVRAAAAAIPRADVLVHAAARFDQATLAEVEIETWRRVQAVNVEAAVLLAQAFAPGMAERGWGRIVHIVSDTIWHPPRPGLLPYVASKAALVGVTRALAARARQRRDHRERGRPRADANARRPRRGSRKPSSRPSPNDRPCPVRSCPTTSPAPSRSCAPTPPRRSPGRR